MEGHLHTHTFMKELVRRDGGIRTDKRLVHIFCMTCPERPLRPLLISDAALNPMPDMATRQDAIRLSAELARRLGAERPKVAILSATESVIDSVPSSVEAAALARWAQDAVPEADVSGPLALDLILSPEAAAAKGLSALPVAGRADAVIVPDIVSGNALFKSLVYIEGPVRRASSSVASCPCC